MLPKAPKIQENFNKKMNISISAYVPSNMYASEELIMRYIATIMYTSSKPLGYM